MNKCGSNFGIKQFAAYTKLFIGENMDVKKWDTTGQKY